jgi:hypothetical protein
MSLSLLDLSKLVTNQSEFRRELLFGKLSWRMILKTDSHIAVLYKFFKT